MRMPTTPVQQRGQASLVRLVARSFEHLESFSAIKIFRQWKQSFRRNRIRTKVRISQSSQQILDHEVRRIGGRSNASAIIFSGSSSTFIQRDALLPLRT